jgi:hypothetical protein
MVTWQNKSNNNLLWTSTKKRINKKHNKQLDDNVHTYSATQKALFSWQSVCYIVLNQSHTIKGNNISIYTFLDSTIEIYSCAWKDFVTIPYHIRHEKFKHKTQRTRKHWLIYWERSQLNMIDAHQGVAKWRYIYRTTQQLVFSRQIWDYTTKNWLLPRHQ